jgi:hypothetical protein
MIQVIHNPGTAVNKGLAKPGPDVTVVVETSYEQFMTRDYQDWLATSPYDRSRSAYMVHSVPEEEVEYLTKALSERAEYLFVTSATCDFYGCFGRSWEKFVAVMADSRRSAEHLLVERAVFSGTGLALKEPSMLS